MKSLKLFKQFQEVFLNQYRTKENESHSFTVSFEKYHLEIDIELSENETEKDILFTLRKDEEEIWGFEIYIGNFNHSEPSEEDLKWVAEYYKKKIESIGETVDLRLFIKEFMKRDFKSLKEDFISRV